MARKLVIFTLLIAALAVFVSFNLDTVEERIWYIGHHPVQALFHAGKWFYGNDHAKIQALLQGFNALLGKLARMRNLPHVARVYDTVASGVPVRIYEPLSFANATDEKRYPAMVFYHGGGFTIGTLDNYEHMCRLLANQADMIVVSVDYRLAPLHKVPSALNDSYAALEWVFANADQLRVDTSRVVVAGDSAGGNLAAAVALKDRDMLRQMASGSAQAAAFNEAEQEDEGGFPSRRIKLQVLIYPAVDMRFSEELHPSIRENANGPILSKALVEWFVECWTRVGHEEEDNLNPYNSPLLAQDHRDLPPAFIQVCELDMLRDEGISYGKKLQEAGVPTVIKLYKGFPHGLVNIVDGFPEVAKPMINDIVDYLKQHLHNE